MTQPTRSPPFCLVYIGAIINVFGLGNVEFVKHALLAVDRDTGIIRRLESFGSAELLLQAAQGLPASNHEICMLPDSQFLIPGLIDMHTHAPQYRNLGLGLDSPLLEWLEKVTFPEERSFSQQEGETTADYRRRIQAIYEPMVQQYLNHGTTTCCYFGSLQVEANKILVDAVAAAGQRALIGKVCMDRSPPADYVESAEQSLEGTEALLNYVRGADAKLRHPGTIRPVVTPRFAISCTAQSLAQLAAVAKREDVHLQTHMNENTGEIALVKSLFPTCAHYGKVYDAAGALGPKTFLAHCAHMTPEEISLLAERQTAISHCPTSNFALNSGVANVRELLAAGIRVGLGSDVSGGYGFSILDAMRQAVIASKVLHMANPEHQPLTVAEVFYLATLGGAEALCLDGEIGNFVVGKKFDAILVDMQACPHIRHADETLQQSLDRFVRIGDDRWIKKVYVNGQIVKDL